MSAHISWTVRASDPRVTTRVDRDGGAASYVVLGLRSGDSALDVFTDSEEWLADTAAALLDARDALREAREGGAS